VSDAVLIALIGAVASVITGIVSVIVLLSVATITSRLNETRLTVAKTHELVNSKMTELIAASAGQAHAEGVIAGEQAQRDRAAEPTI
jgi:hypothetical protein